MASALLVLMATVACDNPNTVVWEGDSGPGKGKHIVFIAGDHEYRSEEALPALARILAKHYGFKATFIVTTDPKDGTIKPGSNHISGLEALKTADLMVVGLRFQDWADDQMQHFVDYLETGKPVIGVRTSTHAFKMKGGKKFSRFSNGYKGEEYKGGFGEQVLGEEWVGHYGRNHRQASNLLIEKGAEDHPILRGVKDAHAKCGGYKAFPPKDATVLARGQILNGMNPTDPPDPSKEVMPVAWTRMYLAEKSGKKGRVFTTTHGASEDILSDGFRRMLVNAHLWCLGMEDQIKADNPVDFVGPYNPAKFSFGGYRKGVKPADIAGWDTPIYSKDAPTKKTK